MIEIAIQRGNRLKKYCTPIQENSIYKKQGPSPISLVRATRIFSKAKTLKKKFDLSLAIGDNPIYPF
jgi:hypothetical protein